MIGVILLVLNQVGTIYSARNLPRPAVPWIQRTSDNMPGRSRPRMAKTVLHLACFGGKQSEACRRENIWSTITGRSVISSIPGINGRLTRRDDGTEVKKFYPPQAEIFAMITEGILHKKSPHESSVDIQSNPPSDLQLIKKLPWVLVLLGVVDRAGNGTMRRFFAAFCSGSVFASFHVSADIRGRIGTIYCRRTHTRKKSDKPLAIGIGNESRSAVFHRLYCRRHNCRRDNRLSFTFSDTIPNMLGKWQYRQAPIKSSKPIIPDQCLALAKSELGEKASDKDVNHLASEIFDLNSQFLPEYVPLRKGMTLNLPGDKTKQMSPTRHWESSLKLYWVRLIKPPRFGTELRQARASAGVAGWFRM